MVKLFFKYYHNTEVRKYVFVGIINTLVTFMLSGLTYTLLLDKLGIVMTGLIASLICINFVFWMQRIYVFKSNGAWLKEYVKFNIGHAFISIITTITMFYLVKILIINIWISQAMTMPIAFLLSYLINKKYTFSNYKKSEVSG